MAVLDDQKIGVTTHGAGNDQCIAHIKTVDVANKPSIMALDAVSDSNVRTTYYLWVDSDGKLRVHTGIPTDQDSDGTVVGAQAA